MRDQNLSAKQNAHLHARSHHRSECQCDYCTSHFWSVIPHINLRECVLCGAKESLGLDGMANGYSK